MIDLRARHDAAERETQMHSLDRMTSEDLAEFAMQVRRYFPSRSEADDSVWKLALERIREIPREIAYRALEAYAMRWGGPRARFIVGKYFEAVDAVRAQFDQERSAARRREESDRRLLESTAEAESVSADWLERRREIEVANPLQVGEAVDLLRGLGWGTPPADFALWSRAWLLAVSDIVTCRRLPGDEQDPERFYSTRAKAPTRPLEPF